MVEVRSRNDRRSDKKQPFVFIAFIITVAIVCFASGFMVGRNSAAKDVVHLAEQGNANKSVASKPIGKSATEKKKASDNLTFYESLPKGDQPPLGSGINLPPRDKAAEKEQVREVVVKKDEFKKPLPDKVFEVAKAAPPVMKTAAVPTPAVKPVKPKADPATARYVLQVASYPQPDEAGKLLGRLTKSDYDVYVQQADLGSKGIWYRVFVGPITGKSQAVALQRRIEKEIKVKPLLRKK